MSPLTYSLSPRWLWLLGIPCSFCLGKKGRWDSNRGCTESADQSGSFLVFTILSLAVCEHRMSFHLFGSLLSSPLAMFSSPQCSRPFPFCWRQGTAAVSALRLSPCGSHAVWYQAAAGARISGNVCVLLFPLKSEYF